MITETWFTLADTLAQNALGYPCRSDSPNDLSITASVWSQITLENTEAFFAANPTLAMQQPFVLALRDQLLEVGLLGDKVVTADCPDCLLRRAAVAAMELGKKLTWSVAQLWKTNKRHQLSESLFRFVTDSLQVYDKQVVLCYRSVTCARPVRFVMKVQGADDAAIRLD